MRPVGQSDCVLNEVFQRVWRRALSRAQHVFISRISISWNNIWILTAKPIFPTHARGSNRRPGHIANSVSNYGYLWLSYCLHKSLQSVSPCQNLLSCFQCRHLRDSAIRQTLYKLISCFNNESVAAKQCSCPLLKSLAWFCKAFLCIFGFS